MKQNRRFRVVGALIGLAIVIVSNSERVAAEQPRHRRAEVTVMSESAEWAEAEAALAAHTEQLLRIPGVVGVGLGRSDDGRPAVHVYFNPSAASRREVGAMIPQAIGKVPVKVIETGAFEAREPQPSTPSIRSDGR